MTTTTTTTISDSEDKNENGSSPSYGSSESDNALNTGNIIDFCDERGILWQPIKVVWELDKNGKMVKKSKWIGYSPKPDDFYGPTKLTDAVFKERQSNYLKYNFIAIDTGSIPQIDIDQKDITEDKKAEYINDNPYYVSLGKGLPHIFVDYNHEGTLKRNSDIDGNKNELLTGQWAWARRDAVVHNFSNPIKRFDLEKYQPSKIKPLKNKKDNYMCLNVTPSETKTNKCLVNLTPDVGKLADKMKTLKLGDTVTPEVVDTLPGFSDLVAEVTRILEIMDAKKRSNYQDWLNVGLALFNSKLHVDLWVNFSKRMDNFDEQECLVKWDSFKAKTGGLTIGSLRYWAKEDNVDEYRIFRKNEILNSKEPITIAIKKACNGNDFDIANVVYLVCKGQYTVGVEDKTKSTLWFKYMKHRWVGNGAMFILEDMSSIVVFHITRVINMYESLISLFPEDKEDKKQESEEEKELREEKGRYETATMLLLKVVNNLKTTSKKRAYLKELECPCYFGVSLKEFKDKLNQNPYLIAFDNGVYDLKEGRFRDGKPEDYITFSTNYDYLPQVKPDVNSFIYNLFWTIFENEPTIKSFIAMLASCICGVRAKEVFSILIGGGGNGKGLLMKLVCLAFGDYYYEMDASQLQDPKIDCGRANSTLSQLKGVRFVSTGELNANYRLRIDTIKKLSGNDKIVHRNLFESEGSYEAQFKMHLSCNTTPPCDDIDDGFARRVEMINFPFKFTENPNPKIKNEKQMDMSLKENIKNDLEIRQGFMLLLIDIYNETGGAYDLSPDMLEITKSYLTEQDKLKCFLDDTIEYTGNDKDYILTRELCDLYMSHENIRITMTKFTPKLKKYIEVVHKKKGNCIVGYNYICRHEEDKEDEDNEV